MAKREMVEIRKNKDEIESLRRRVGIVEAKLSAVASKVKDKVVEKVKDKDLGGKVLGIVLIASMLFVLAPATVQAEPVRADRNVEWTGEYMWFSGTTYMFGRSNYKPAKLDLLYAIITTGVTFEGTSPNAYTTEVNVTDPTADRHISLPNWSGGIPVLYSLGPPLDCMGNTYGADWTISNDSSYLAGVSVPAGWLTDGSSMKFVVTGGMEGGNAAKVFALYVEDAAKGSITTDAGAVHDWRYEVTISGVTDSAHQMIDAMLWVEMPSGTTNCWFTHDEDTHDFSSAGSLNVKITSGNAGDAIIPTYQEIWVVQESGTSS